MRKRTKARELALQALYQLDLRGEEVRADVLADVKTQSEGDAEVEAFAVELLDGAWGRRSDIDKAITDVAKNWELRRMAALDRNILRIAVYELLFRDDIPALVTINEAIDVAKKYSTRRSGHFVNGILDQVRLHAAPEAKRGPAGRPPAPAEEA